MRRLLPLLFLLAACSDAPTERSPHDAEADRLLAHVTGDAWDAVWAAAASRGETYRQMGVTEIDAMSFDVPEDGDVDGLPPNPLPAFLSDEPPYLDAAAREQYTTRVLGDTTIAGRTATLVEARFVADERRTQAIRVVRAAVADTTLLWIGVGRESESILFDEQSQLSAALTVIDGAMVPDYARIVTSTDVPASEVRALATGWRLAR